MSEQRLGGSGLSPRNFETEQGSFMHRGTVQGGVREPRGEHLLPQERIGIVRLWGEASDNRVQRKAHASLQV